VDTAAQADSPRRSSFSGLAPRPMAAPPAPVRLQWSSGPRRLQESPPNGAIRRPPENGRRRIAGAYRSGPGGRRDDRNPNQNPAAPSGSRPASVREEHAEGVPLARICICQRREDAPKALANDACRRAAVVSVRFANFFRQIRRALAAPGRAAPAESARRKKAPEKMAAKAAATESRICLAARPLARGGCRHRPAGTRWAYANSALPAKRRRAQASQPGRSPPIICRGYPKMRLQNASAPLRQPIFGPRQRR
jgi:hypothetical protein